MVVYEMLTGHPPFDGDSTVVVAMKLIHDVPTPPGQLNPNIPAVLKEIIMRCLEKEPERRFRDGSELAQSLAVLLQAERVRNTMRPHPSYPCMRVDRWVATLRSTEDVGMETNWHPFQFFIESVAHSSFFTCADSAGLSKEH